MATSKKTKTVKTKNPVANETVKKARKPYPSRDERLEMLDKKIARLEKLNDSRKTLIEKTEKTLNERKAALQKSEKQLASAIASKAKLTAPKPEKGLSARKKNAEQNRQYAALAEALKISGKTIDEVLEALK